MYIPESQNDFITHRKPYERIRQFYALIIRSLSREVRVDRC